MSLESLIWTCNPIFIPQVFNLKLLSLFDISSAMLARHSRRAIPTITKWVRMNGGSNHNFSSNRPPSEPLSPPQNEIKISPQPFESQSLRMPELDLGDPDLSPSQQALLHELAASCTTQAELDELLSSSDLERLLSLQELQDIIDTPEPILTSLPIPGKSIYPPFHHEPKWRIPVATITFKGYDAQALELFTHFSVHVASSLGIPTSKVYTLPKQRRLWTVLKSPFVFKKAQENFERITHSRGIKAWDADLEIVNIWTSMLRQHTMPGVGMRIVKWTRLEVGGGSQDLKDVEGEVRGVFKAQDAERVRKLGAQIVESELADQSESETTLAEENSAGDKPAEGERAEQRVEGELVGQSEPEVKLEEEKLVEDKPVEEKLTEGQSAEDTLTEVKLAEDKLAEGKSAEGESKPTEGKPAEGRQAEDKLAEQKLIEEQRTTEA